MMKAWEKNVRRTEPYVPGEQPQAANLIKLNTNENPYPPAPGVKAVLRCTDAELLRRYPDPTAGALVRAIADFHGFEEENVFVGVGSDDVLGMSFLTFFAGEKPILFPDITYSFYDVWANLFGIPYERPALDDDFRLREEDYLRENGGIVIANPNAPTSLAEPVSVIEKIAAGNPESVVIVDEAYVDFGGESALPLVRRYDNVLVVRTFSKSRSLAGLRIGYAIGDPALIQALNAIKYSYNSYTMSAVTIAAGVASVEDRAYFEETCARVCATREASKEALSKLGFTFPDSKTNFIFAKHASVPAAYLFAELKKRNIYVRYFALPRIDNYLRITVGTPEEMERLCAALAEILEAYPGK